MQGGPIGRQDVARQSCGMTRNHDELRELDRRNGGGMDVRLVWNSRTDRLYVVVIDAQRDDDFRVAVEAGDALEAFHHPYAYRRPGPASRRARALARSTAGSTSGSGS